MIPITALKRKGDPTREPCKGCQSKYARGSAWCHLHGGWRDMPCREWVRLNPVERGHS